MNALQKGWFSEVDKTLWPGHCFSLVIILNYTKLFKINLKKIFQECDKLLYEGKSKYQDVLVFNKYKIFRLLNSLYEKLIKTLAKNLEMFWYLTIVFNALNQMSILIKK